MSLSLDVSYYLRLACHRAEFQKLTFFSSFRNCLRYDNTLFTPEINTGQHYMKSQNIHNINKTLKYYPNTHTHSLSPFIILFIYFVSCCFLLTYLYCVSFFGAEYLHFTIVCEKNIFSALLSP